MGLWVTWATNNLSQTVFLGRRSASLSPQKCRAGFQEAMGLWVQLDTGPHGPWTSLLGPGATCWAQSNDGPHPAS